MNEDVLDMIDTLHARLNDVCEAVEGLAEPIPEYVQRLDRIDDQIYAVQCELERRAHPNAGDADGALAASDNGDAEPVASGDAAVQSSKSSSEKKEILTDEMKENLADAGRAVGHVLRDSKEVVSELSGTVSEIKDLFSLKPGKKH